MIANIARCFFLCLAVLPWLWYRISTPLVGKNKAFQGMSQACSLVPGKLGELLRAAFYRLALPQSSQRTAIAFLSTFSDPRARLDAHVSIGAYCNIGWAHIGEDCILSSHVCITSGKNEHAHEDIHTPIRLQQGQANQVSIGAHCWIGANATIMAHVGQGSIIAAGAVVTKPIAPYSIAAGVPAKVIGSRLQEGQSAPENLISQKKPVVLQLLTTLNMGGAERLALGILEKNTAHIQGIVGAIYSQNNEKGDLATLAESLHIPHFNLEAGKCGRLQIIWRLYRALRKHNVDLVHTHAAYLLNFAVPAAKLAGIPVVFTEHSTFDLEQIPKLRRTIKYTAPFLSGITCISQPIANYFTQTFHISTPPMQLIENGVDTQHFYPKKPEQDSAVLPEAWTAASPKDSEKESGAELFIFGTVARLCPEKDHPTLLRAFAQVAREYAHVRLLMVGDGAERARTEALIEQLGLKEKVHITGKCLNIVEHLHSMNIFVMSSEHEGLPMAILEAMACGVPVISTDAGNIGALNTTGQHVYLVPKKDPEALANAMKNMYNEQKLRENFADRALNFVVQEKSAYKMADAYYSVFKNAGLKAYV